MIDGNAHTRETAVFAGGCFWCLEAVFLLLRGVEQVRPGYTGGHIRNPPYREVCTGRTGHAEAVRIDFDPTVIPFEILLAVFFGAHDPTTLNRQGNDKGTQYRSEIFYTTTEQEYQARRYMERLTSENVFDHPIVTQLSPASDFFLAEEEHRNYYRRNIAQPYCQVIISPKIGEIKRQFRQWLRN